MKKIILLLLAGGLFFASCQQNHKRERRAKSIKVKCYKQHSNVSDNDPNNDWIFWYLIMQNNGSCSYYSSPVPVTNYNSVAWTKSEAPPKELQQDNPNIEEQPEQEVQVDDLSTEMQTEIDSSPEDYCGMTYEELGDYENSTQDIDNNSDSGTDSDGGSSDSGGGDSGGGDSGGGDGGGGGE